MTIRYVYAENNMYNCALIYPVRWWNKIFGFPGRTVISTVSFSSDITKHSPELYEIAKQELAESGFHPHILGVKL